MAESKQLLGLVVLGAGIVASFAHHIHYFATTSAPFQEIWVSFMVPIWVLLTGFLVVGYIYRSEIEPLTLGRVAIWYVGGGLAFGLAGYFSLRSNVMGLPSFSMIRLSVANWAIGGSFIGLLLGFYDARQSNAVTKARARERDADRQARRLSVLNRILRHDIRNKLTVITGHVDLLESTSGGESPEIIKRAAHELLEIADRARKLHQITEEREPQQVDLSGYLSQAVDDVHQAYPAVQISTDVTDGITAVTYPVVGDNIRDLITNAIVHNDHEEEDIAIDIDLRRVRRPAGEFAEIVIRDNGPGIPIDEQVILEEGGETQLNHSLGTGLWLTRWVAEESHGEFEFDSPADGGTRIELRLPTVLS